MPRHPPIALKTLDRSHCQYPSRDPKDRRFSQIPKDFSPGAIPKGLSPQVQSKGLSLQARPRRSAQMLLAQKDQLLEIGSRVRLGKPIICGRLSVSRDKSQPFWGYEVRTNLLFTMSYRTGGEPRSSPQIFLTNDLPTGFPSLLDTPSSFSEKGSDNPADCAKWWSRTGSNRRHPACKAGALPAELRPLDNTSSKLPCRGDRQSLRIAKWWAWEDLNLRPHAYQARALTN